LAEGVRVRRAFLVDAALPFALALDALLVLALHVEALLVEACLLDAGLLGVLAVAPLLRFPALARGLVLFPADLFPAFARELVLAQPLLLVPGHLLLGPVHVAHDVVLVPA